DDIDEGNETFEFEIRNPDPAIVTIARGTAVGTVENDGPLPSAWLARFGGTVAEQAIDGIAARIESARAGPGTAGFRGAIGGAPIGGGGATALDATCGPEDEAATPEAENAKEGPAAPAAPSCTANAGASAQAGATADPHGRNAWGGNPGPRGSANARAPFRLQPAAMGGVAGAPHGAGFGAGLGQGHGIGGLGAPAPGQGPGYGPAGTHTAQSATLLSLVMGSSFTYTRNEDGRGGALGFWGRGAHTTFNGRDGALDLDGEVGTALLGADYAKGDWLAGIALTRSFAAGGYANPENGSGAVESTLTAAIPYAAWDASERIDLWGAAGRGAGHMTLTPGGERKGLAGPVHGMASPPPGVPRDAPLEELRTDIGWSMATAGLRASLLTGNVGGPSLAAVSDALWSRTTSDETDGMMAGAGEVTRLRVGLEGGWTFGLSGGATLTPKIEAGVRHDGGDAETGFGVELGGGLNWTDPKRGLVLDIEGRTLMAHEADGRRDIGFSASLGYDPRPESPLGLSLNLRHAFGGQSSGGLDALFASDPLVPMGQGGAGQWTAEAAWGLPAFNDRFTGKPTLGYGVLGSGREVSLGWFLEPAAENAPDLRLGLKLTRRESATEPPQHGIAVETAASW
ncbi:MAG: autotransporter outer membrane beta-barrel domain-containing protein, partial [Gammaproteobacteria bacterium]|nr:autotransporter outer membrane beta-barrel domain-containing protein [Gammaproteobacteria bacterium]